jgi:hypothetical protein
MKTATPIMTRLGGTMAAMLLAGGCAAGPVGSLHPLYRTQDLVATPSLAGSWREYPAPEAKESPTTWTLQPAAGATYRLAIAGSAADPPLTFTAGLARLGDYLFFDLTPDDPLIWRYVFAGHLVRLHIFFRLWVDRNAFMLQPLSADWIVRSARAGDIRVPYVVVDDQVVLVAPTADLQRFVLTYADDAEAFPRSSRVVFVRVDAP